MTSTIEIPADVIAIRHGETEWSRSGRHTGRTDIPLTEAGRQAAKRLRPAFEGFELTRVLSSPLRRARATCELAGFGSRMEIEPDLEEWNYGDYEGLTSDEIARRAPGWMVFTDGCPGGESPEDVQRRVDRVIAKIRDVSGRVALFGHGHVLRALAARWVDLPLSRASQFLLDTSTVSVLGYYRDTPAVKRWNAPTVEWRQTT
jgi:broad specificity phosphatase PhoE